MRGSLPLHFARNSWEIGSLFGGSSWTGSLGSNFPAMMDLELMCLEGRGGGIAGVNNLKVGEAAGCGVNSAVIGL